MGCFILADSEESGYKIRIRCFFDGHALIHELCQCGTLLEVGWFGELRQGSYCFLNVFGIYEQAQRVWLGQTNNSFVDELVGVSLPLEGGGCINSPREQVVESKLCLDVDYEEGPRCLYQ